MEDKTKAGGSALPDKIVNDPGLDAHQRGQEEERLRKEALAKKEGKGTGKSAKDVKRSRKITTVKEFEDNREAETEAEVYSVDDTVIFQWGENLSASGKQFMKPGTKQKLHIVHAESLEEKGFGKIIGEKPLRPKLPPESGKVSR